MNVAPQSYILGVMLETFAWERNLVCKCSYERQKYGRVRGAIVIILTVNITPPRELFKCRCLEYSVILCLRFTHVVGRSEALLFTRSLTVACHYKTWIRGRLISGQFIFVLCLAIPYLDTFLSILSHLSCPWGYNWRHYYSFSKVEMWLNRKVKRPIARVFY
jgi:hypothetical protein